MAVDYLLHEIQVVGTPGEGFCACGAGYFRFSTFGSPEDTKEAARRISELLKNDVWPKNCIFEAEVSHCCGASIH